MQTEMNKLFAEGGVMQEGGTVDPVSGNEVPPGAMAEEVRDDIPAQLSEGEFVFPADVVRFYGLEKLMMMRDKAKKGLQRMNEIGQMGNAEEVPDGEALFGGEQDEMDDDTFSSEIDSIMSEDSGGEEREYAKGGDVRKYAPGGYVGGEENKQLYRDAPIKGFEMVPMTNDAGQTIYIPFINGVAQLSIPSGYKVKKSGDVAKPEDEKPVETAPTTGGDGGGGGGDSGPLGGDNTNTDGTAKDGKQGISNAAISAGLAGMAFGQSKLGKGISMLLGIPLSTAANVVSPAILDQQLDALGEASDKMSDVQNSNIAGQVGIRSDESGNITTFSNQDTIDKYDQEVFGTTSSQMSNESAADVAMSEAVNDAAAQEAAAGFEAPSFDAGQPSYDSNSGSDTNSGSSDNSGGYGGVDSGGYSGDGSGGYYAKGGFVPKRKNKKTGKSTSFVTRQK